VIDVIAAIALGIAAGMLAGLFGVGGGILFVPTLTLILGLAQVEAEATSLLAIVPVALVGSWRNTKAGTVRWRDAAAIGIFSIGTGFAGAAIANAVADRGLRIAFAGLIVLTAAQLIWRCIRRPRDEC
jgi:uncharacterized membrane protein YfcA